MTTIPLASISENGHNIRRTPATAEQDAQLVESVRALGILQPILLRSDDRPGGGFLIVAGHRRVAAARAIGLSDIPAEIVLDMDEATAVASQAAENIVRAGMDPVDQWRAIAALQKTGYTLAGAAQALGISERRAKQLDKLGQIEPDILALIAGNELPQTHTLALIASAPAALQRKAFKGAPKGATPHYRLIDIARNLQATKIPRARAIFDTEKSKIRFEEDLFAEPGSDGQFTTRDVAGFITAQKAALQARVTAAKKKGDRVTLTDYKQHTIVLPKGWERHHAPIKTRYPAKGKLMLFVAVREDSGAQTGGIEECAAMEIVKPKPVTKPPADAQGDEETTMGDDVAAPAESALTKKGQTLLAAMKTDALRDRIENGDDLPLETLCLAMMLALTGDNVIITGTASKWARTDFGNLRSLIVSPGGAFNILNEGAVAKLMQETLSHIVRMTDPATNYGSGVVAEWIGAAVRADSALPRFDTPEFLACMSKDALADVAAKHGRTGLKTAAGLREALAGSLEEWRPTTFGAPGPTDAVAEPDKDEDDVEDQAA